MDSLASATDVARLLGVSRAWVIAHADSGDLPAYRVGRYWRFDQNEVAVWLSEQGNPPTRGPDSRRMVLPVDRHEAMPAPVRLDSVHDGARVADELDVPFERVRDWVNLGLLPGIVVPGGVRVDADALQQWRQILAGHPTLPDLERGQLRSTAIRTWIEGAILQRRYGEWARTPGSARRGGQRIPTWAEVFPSGRA